MNNLYRPISILFTALLFSGGDILAQCENASVSAGDDKYICNPPMPVTLEGSVNGQYLSVLWTPPIGLIGANTLSPTANVLTTTTYVLTARVPDFDENLISNGDFSAGTSGFSSDYSISPGNLWLEGTYDITNNPQADHANFAPCADHTGGGDMMVVNGSGDAGVNVWCQSVDNILPNTEYIFSAWVTSVISTSPAQLQFSINGQLLGGVFTAPAGTCGWANFYQIWNSGGGGSANICIVNQNTALSGNDFALDDLAFWPICKPKDTVTVHVVNVKAVANPPQAFILCDGAPLTLNGTGSTTGANVSYQWTTNGGNIVSGATTLNPVVNQAGEYILNVTYDDGNIICEKQTSVNVSLSNLPLAPLLTVPPPLSCSQATVNLVAGANQGPGPFNYEWSTATGNIVSGANSAVCTVSLPGDYTVTLTSPSTGCTATGTVTVTSNGLPPAAVATADTLDCLSPTTVLSGAGSSTGPLFNYAWTTIGGAFSGSTTNLNSTASASGTYILQVTNTGNGCVRRDTVVVLSNIVQPDVSISSPGTLNCLNSSVNLNASSTTSGLNYAWTASSGGQFGGSQNTASTTATAPGIFQVIGTNPLNGCRDTAVVSVSGNFAVPPILIATPDVINCTNSSVNLSATTTSGQNFTTVWTAVNGGNIVSGEQTLTPTVNAAGVYMLVVTDPANGCSSQALVTVQADQNVASAVATASAPITCVSSTVNLSATGSSSGPGIFYAWTAVSPGTTVVSGSNSNSPVVSGAGVYQLEVTNNLNGCTATDLVTVLEDKTAPTVQISPPTTLGCLVSSVQLNAQNSSAGQNFNFAWSTADGHFSANQNTLQPSIDQAGTYTLTIENQSNGCSATASVTVQNDASTPTVSVAPPNVLNCQNPQAQLSATVSDPNATLSWTTTNGSIVSGSTGLNPIVVSVGIYCMTATNTLSGCTASFCATVTGNFQEPAADAGPAGTLTCKDQTFNLTASQTPGMTYNWSTATGNFTAATNSFSTTCDEPGIYAVTVTDPTNGCTASDQVEILENKNAPDVQIPPVPAITCAQPLAILTAIANGLGLGYEYDWSTTNGTIVAGDDTATPTVSEGGIYEVTVTETANGCTATASIAVQQNAVFPAANAGPSKTLTCDLLETQLSATADSGPGIAYLWQTADGTIVSGETTLNPTVSQSGTYVLQVSNSNTGCTGTSVVEILENKTPPTAEAGQTATLSCGTNSLQLDGAGSSAGNNFTYDWTTANGNLTSGQTTLNPTISAPGEYNLVVTDETNGCTASDVVTILKDSNAPNIAIASPEKLTCQKLQTMLSGSSSDPNVTVIWSTSNGVLLSGQTTMNPTVGAIGTYCLTATSTVNGCSSTTCETVANDVEPPTVNAGIDKKITCDNLQVSLQGSASASGNPNLTTVWTSASGSGILLGGSTLVPTINQTGTFTLTVTNLANGCTASDWVVVTADTLVPTVVMAPPPVLTCTAQTVNLSATVGSPAGNFSTTWKGLTAGTNIVSGGTTLSPTVNEPGIYNLIVENLENGCAKSVNVLVPENVTVPNAEAGATAEITCDNPQVTLNGAGSSAGANFVYDWTGAGIISGKTTLTPTVSQAGTFTLQVTDQTNGCTKTDVVEVTANTVPPPVSIAQPGVLTCVVKTVVLDASGSGAGVNFSATWSTPSGNIVSGGGTLNPTVNAPGTYVLNIENQANGCVSTANVVVSENINSPSASIAAPEVLHCNQTEIQLQGNSSTAGNLTFNWSSSGGGNLVSGSESATPTIDAPGKYSMTVTNALNGCTNVSETSVSEIPDPGFSSEIVQPDCNELTGSLDFQQVTGGQSPFSYSIDGGANLQASPNFENLSPGNYDLKIVDANGCEATSTVQVETPFVPTLEIKQVDKIEVGDSTRLIPELNFPATNVVSWLWSPAENLSCATCQNPWASPDYTTSYSLIISDLNGCTAEARVLLEVDRDRHVFVPNVFSPNEDGVNEMFTVYGKNVLKVRNFRVYDRWGNALFDAAELDANDEQAGWNGKFRDKAMNPGVYVWYCEVEFLDGEKRFYSGDVTVLE